MYLKPDSLWLLFGLSVVVKSLIIGAFEQLQQQHCELASWHLSFDFARRRAGACYPTQQRLTISQHHLELNEWPVVKDTLLHEVAHALAWERYREKGHGPYWRQIVKQLGGEAKATGRFKLPEAQWVVVLRDSERKHIVKIADRFRRNRSIRYWVLKGKPESAGKLFYVSQEQYQAWSEQQLSFNELRFYQ